MEKEAAGGVVLSVVVGPKLGEAVLSLMVDPELGGPVSSLAPEQSALVKRRLGFGGDVGVAMTAIRSLTVSCTPGRGLTEVDVMAAFFLSALASAKKAFNFR